MTGKIRIEGIQGHVAYPDRIKNPIHALVRICDRVSGMDLEKHGGEDDTTVQVVRFESDSGADNVVPAFATATVNLRYNPMDDPADLRSAVEKICGDEDAGFSCDWQESSMPYRTDPNGKMAKNVSEACRETLGAMPLPSVGGGTSDGRFFCKDLRRGG